jgi:predicted N-acyltransferase
MSIQAIMPPTRQDEPGELYTFTVRKSIDDRSPEEWGPFHEGQADPMMDPRFLRVVERSMGRVARFWNVVFRDGEGTPVAAAFLSLYAVDGALLAAEPWARALQSARRVAPGLLKIRVLFCGCPVSTGQNHLRFEPGADHAQVLRLLDRLMLDLAREHQARWVVFKEFDDLDAAKTDDLIPLGYLRAESPRMNCLPARFRDLDDLCASLRSHYRRKIQLSRKKLEKSGLQVVHLRGGDGLDRLYTEDVHRLYLSVLDRADVRLECLPSDFFRELGRQFPEDATFTFLRQGERIVAFSCGLFHDDSYQNFFVGYEPVLNAEADLYFNAMLMNLDFAMRKGVRAIHVGQTADEFKSRIGCYAESRYFYVKARNPIGHLALRWARPYLFPVTPETTERNVFK